MLERLAASSFPVWGSFKQASKLACENDCALRDLAHDPELPAIQKRGEEYDLRSVAYAIQHKKGKTDD